MLLAWTTLFVLTVSSVNANLFRSNTNMDYSNGNKCHIEDKDSHTVNDIVILKETGEHEFKTKCTTWNVGYTITPELPTNATFDPLHGTFTINSAFSFTKTVFTITAISEHENNTVVFSIDLKECEYGDPVRIDVEGNLLYTLDNSELGYHYQSSKSSILCIPYKTYTSSLKCYYDSSPVTGCQITIHYDNEKPNQHYYTRRQYIRGEETNEDFHFGYNQQPPVIRTRPFPVLTCFTLCDSYLLDIEGKVTKMMVEPEPVGMTCRFQNNDFTCDQYDHSYKNASTHTITLMNDYGKTTFTMTFAINQRPDHYKLINIFRFHDTRKTDYYFLLDGFKYIPDRSESSLCLSESNDLAIHMTSVTPGLWHTGDPLQISEVKLDFNHGAILGYYTLRDDRLQETRHFRYKVLVDHDAVYKYYKNPVSDDWMNSDFNDKNWLEGQSGQWGEYEAQPVYFRKSFDINSIDIDFLITLVIETNGDCIGYLNGQEIVHLHDIKDKVSYHKFLSTSVLKQHNILAFKYFKQANKDDKSIQFYSTMHLTSSTCAYQPKKDLFKSSPTNSGILTGSTSSHDYTFDYGDAVVSNQVEIHRKVNGIGIKSFMIQGIIGNETVLLYKTNNPFMVNNDYKVVNFENSRAFTTYRLIFYNDDQWDIWLQLTDIKFALCNRLYCSQQHDLPHAIEGTVHYKKCPFGQLGKRQIQCSNNEHGAEWIEKANTCLKRIPPQSVSFVDWTFEIEHCSYDDWFGIESNITKLITTNLPVFKYEINYIFMNHVIINNMDKITVFVRFDVDSTIGDYVTKHLKRLSPSFNTLVKEYTDDWYESSIISIKLRNPINYGLLIICIVVILIIFVLSLLLYRSRLALKTATGKKSLKKGASINLNEGNKATLLLPSEE